MNIAMLVNPAARNGATTHAGAQAAARLREHGHVVTVHTAGSADESERLIGAALQDGADAVVVAGGDGTINLALQHLAGTDIPLGIVPVGTGNDFAAHLGIRALDPETAADIIAAGNLRTVDLAQTTGSDGISRLFATVLASGFDSYVNDRANRMRWPRGDLRYTIAILIEFLFLRETPYTLDVDSRIVEGPFVMASVGNSRTYGGGIQICPDAATDDGLLDVTIVRPAGRVRLLRLIPKVYRGTHVGHPLVETYRGRTVRLNAAGITAYADGDPIGALPLTVEALPAALTVFAPPA